MVSFHDTERSPSWYRKFQLLARVTWPTISYHDIEDNKNFGHWSSLSCYGQVSHKKKKFSSKIATKKKKRMTSSPIGFFGDGRIETLQRSEDSSTNKFFVIPLLIRNMTICVPLLTIFASRIDFIKTKRQSKQKIEAIKLHERYNSVIPNDDDDSGV